LADLPGYPMGWLAQQIAPFRWSAIRRASEGHQGKE
jgi:hypothetical protein